MLLPKLICKLALLLVGSNSCDLEKYSKVKASVVWLIEIGMSSGLSVLYVMLTYNFYSTWFISQMSSFYLL